MAEVNNIPKLRFPEFSGEWVEDEFGKFYEFKSTNSYSRDQLNYESGEVYNIHYGDIHTKFISRFYLQSENIPFINNEINLEKITEDKFFKEGDLVIADASEDYDDIGKTIELINLHGKRVLAGLHTLLARRINDGIFVGFGTYLMVNEQVRRQIKLIAQGSKVLGITAGRVSKIKLKIPLPEEQQKIATFLSSADERLSQLSKKKQLLEQYKKGMMQKIFSQEIRFKDENGGDFPDWVEKSVGEVFDLQDGYSFLSRDFVDSGSDTIQVIRITDINNQNTNHEKVYVLESIIDELKLNRFLAKKGDLLLSLTGAAGFNFFLWLSKPSLINQRTIKISPKKNESEFLKFLLSPLIKKQINSYGSGQNNNLSKELLKGINFIAPKEVIEQAKIANFLTTLDDKISQTQTQITKAKNFKKGLLQQMFI